MGHGTSPLESEYGGAFVRLSVFTANGKTPGHSENRPISSSIESNQTCLWQHEHAVVGLELELSTHPSRHFTEKGVFGCDTAAA